MCPITGTYPYTWYADTALSAVADTWRTYATQPVGVSDSKWRFWLSWDTRNVERLATFYFKPTVTGGHIHWATDPSNSSQIMQLHVKCGPSSATVAESALYYSTLYQTQYCDISPGGTPSFLLPLWTSTSPQNSSDTNGPCPLNVFVTSSSIASDVAMASLNHPS